MAEADRATSRWSMFFSRRRTKDTALDALARLEAILGEPAVRGLRDAVAAQERAVDPASYESGALWNEYLQNAAGINAVLSTVGAAPADGDAARGFVAEELRQRITAIPLDLSRLTATLRGYQVFGSQYAIHQERSILGDEMGLGKTVQALAVLAHLVAKGQRRFMVVCPASVQINWIKETAKHSTLATHTLHGAGRDDAGRRWLREGGVAVTTFGTLARLPAAVREADVAMLIVDEAHYVKNPDAARSQAIAAAVGRAQRALFLTGTPMENRVEEFRTLVNYLQPQVARNVDPADAVAGANVFRRAVAPVYLRRNQADVLTELLEKIETEAWVQFGEGEEAAYRGAVQRRNLQAMRQAGFGPGSAKLGRLREIVEEAALDGMKVLVFSYFLAALETYAREFSVVGTITGSVAPAARQQLVGGVHLSARSRRAALADRGRRGRDEHAGRVGGRASTNGSVRSRRTSGSCSTTSPAAARRRRPMSGRWIPHRTGRRRSTTSRFQWSVE